MRLTLLRLLALAEPSSRGWRSSAPSLCAGVDAGLVLCATTRQPRRRQVWL